jgi:hypothetical protein
MDHDEKTQKVQKKAKAVPLHATKALLGQKV